jgi:hypothetical protein
MEMGDQYMEPSWFIIMPIVVLEVYHKSVFNPFLAFSMSYLTSPAFSPSPSLIEGIPAISNLFYWR